MSIMMLATVNQWVLAAKMALLKLHCLQPFSLSNFPLKSRGCQLLNLSLSPQQKGQISKTICHFSKNLIQKRKVIGPQGFFQHWAQTESTEDLSSVGDILVLPNPHHGLDVPKLKKVPYPSALGPFVIMNQEYVCQMAQLVVSIPDR